MKACISRFAMAILSGETELVLGTISVKQAKMLMLSVKAKMLCLKTNLIRAKALLPKENLL